MKSEGWQYLQLAGPYREYGRHAAAFPAFADRVENALREEADLYLTEVVKEDARKPGAV
jgi:hypothetical protein